MDEVERFPGVHEGGCAGAAESTNGDIDVQMKSICEETKVSGEVAICYVSLCALVVEVRMQGRCRWGLVFAEMSDTPGNTAGSTFAGIRGKCEPNGLTRDTIFLLGEAKSHCGDAREQEWGDSGSFVFSVLVLETDVFEREGVGSLVGFEVLAGPKEKIETEPNQIGKGLDERIQKVAGSMAGDGIKDLARDWLFADARTIFFFPASKVAFPSKIIFTGAV